MARIRYVRIQGFKYVSIGGGSLPPPKKYGKYMPYIKKEYRTELDPLIDQLSEVLVKQAKEQNFDGAFMGLLNYVCTRLVLQVIKKQFGKLRYWLVAGVAGTFKNIADEFYRRVGVPYEDKQITKNGDVDFYSEFSEEIDKM